MGSYSSRNQSDTDPGGHPHPNLHLGPALVQKAERDHNKKLIFR